MLVARYSSNPGVFGVLLQAMDSKDSAAIIVILGITGSIALNDVCIYCSYAFGVVC